MSQKKVGQDSTILKLSNIPSLCISNATTCDTHVFPLVKLHRYILSIYLKTNVIVFY